MAPILCAQLGLSFGGVLTILAWPLAESALAQARHAVHVSPLEGRIAPSPSGESTSPSSLLGYPHARGYNHPYATGWPYSSVRGYAYGYTPTYRLRQWGPDGRPFLVPGKPFKGLWIDDDDRQWRYWSHVRDSKKRTERLLAGHAKMMARGLEAFAAGDYGRATSAFVLAGSMNQHDPACRVHLAHSYFALGRYRLAVGALRQAFWLEPRIRELPYDVRTDYGRPQDFAAHLAALKRSVQAFPSEADLPLLLAYVSYYSGQQDAAYPALLEAKRRSAKDGPNRKLISLFMEVCKPSPFLARKTDE